MYATRVGAIGGVATGGLAWTGFNAIWFALIGTCLITSGFLVLRVVAHRRPRTAD